MFSGGIVKIQWHLMTQIRAKSYLNIAQVNMNTY